MVDHTTSRNLADFSIWLYGQTGSGKSELAALIQSFFGRFNALEVIAHAAKDTIFVVDDFKPTGSRQDRNRLMRDADRLLRAQGNQQGRQRRTYQVLRAVAGSGIGVLVLRTETIVCVENAVHAFCQ